MRVTEITYGRTINLGNYESERIDMTAQVDEDETAEDALALLEAQVALAASTTQMARRARANEFYEAMRATGQRPGAIDQTTQDLPEPPDDPAF